MKKLITIILFVFASIIEIQAQKLEREIYKKEAVDTGFYIRFGEGAKNNGNKEGLWTEYTVFLDSDSDEYIADYLNSEDQRRLKFSEGLYINDQKTGEWTFYDANGRLKGLVTFEDGEVIRQQNYYEDGQLELVNISDGQPSGQYKAYHENGQLMQIGEFDNGTRIGEWKFYHNNGKLQTIGKFESGKQTGEWRYYHENGELKGLGRFENGNKIGEWKIYDEDGKLTETQQY